jgi:hypothetical protein
MFLKGVFINELCFMQRKKNDTMKILLANKGKASAQIAHLQFLRAYAQTLHCKRAIFCQRT